MMTQISNPTFNMSGDLIDQLNMWEDKVSKLFSCSGETLSDGIKIAALTNILTDPLLTHLQLAVQSADTEHMSYEQFRLCIKRFYMSKRTWSVSAVDGGKGKGKKGKQGCSDEGKGAG